MSQTMSVACINLLLRSELFLKSSKSHLITDVKKVVLWSRTTLLLMLGYVISNNKPCGSDNSEWFLPSNKIIEIYGAANLISDK